MATAIRSFVLAGQDSIIAPAAPVVGADSLWPGCGPPEWHALRIFGPGRHGAFDRGSERHHEL
jgi:hypothetical protein